MEEKLIQLNCTERTISDDKGNLQTIKSIANLEKILNKENEIKDINNTITGLNKSLKEVQHNEKVRKALNIFILIGGTLMTLVGITSSVSIIKTIVPIVYTLLIMKALSSVIYGIKILNKRKIKKLTTSIKADSQKVETLTKELNNLKTKSNYQTAPYSKTKIKSMEQPTYEHNPNKIKRLIYDNNI